jgi:hypothetical protein
MGNLRSSDFEVSKNYLYSRYITRGHVGHHGLRHDTFVYQLDGVDILKVQSGSIEATGQLTFIDSDNPYGYTLSQLGGGFITVADDGVELPRRDVINFTGTGVTITDSPSSTIIDILAGTGDVAIENEINANITVGGVTTGDSYPVGTDVRDIVANILQAYIPPRFNSLAVVRAPSATTYEVGQAVTIGAATWAVSNDSEGNPPQSMYLAGEGFNTSVTGVSQAVTPGTIITPTSQSTYNWVISGLDGDSASIPNRSVSVSWLFRHYFGAVSNNYSSSATTGQIQSLIDNLQYTALRSGKARTVVATSFNNDPTNYTYIAYAAVHGVLTDVRQGGVLSILSNFEDLGTFNYTNAYGHTEPYRVYKNVDPGAFGVGVELVIS